MCERSYKNGNEVVKEARNCADSGLRGQKTLEKASAWFTFSQFNGKTDVKRENQPKRAKSRKNEGKMDLEWGCSASLPEYSIKR